MSDGTYRSAPEWKFIPGTKHEYAVNDRGEFARITGSGKRPIKIRASDRQAPQVEIKLNGKRVKRAAARIVWELFKGPFPRGMRFAYRDGDSSNVSLENLRVEPWPAKRYEKRNVEKIAEDGTVVAVYANAKEAAAADYMDYTAVINRLNGKVKKAYKPTGFSYRWKDAEE